jgi:hypothetical protein
VIQLTIDDRKRERKIILVLVAPVNRFFAARIERLSEFAGFAGTTTIAK